MSSDRRFAKLGFEDFRRLAADSSLSQYERIGFPDSYRQGFEEAIFSDIRQKVSNLDQRGKKILDIGPGCSDLPKMIIGLAEQQGHELTLVDSEEMLKLLPEGPTKVAARYPDCPELVERMTGRFDAILCYSVLHYIFVDTVFFKFLDTSLALLAPGGQMLIGDIPNISKRKRFFSSETGVRFHQRFMQTSEKPAVEFNRIEPEQIDDAVILGILQRARAAGFEAYVIPQGSALPLANRREDILITRP